MQGLVVERAKILFLIPLMMNLHVYSNNITRISRHNVSVHFITIHITHFPDMKFETKQLTSKILCPFRIWNIRVVSLDIYIS
jgi:hypothetical protein